MSYVTYSNHFYTKVFTSGLSSTIERGQDNPCHGISINEPVPSKYKRLQLVVQNQGTEEVSLYFGDYNDLGLKLYAGQSISFENYNGGIYVSNSNQVLVFETFA